MGPAVCGNRLGPCRTPDERKASAAIHASLAAEAKDKPTSTAAPPVSTGTAFARGNLKATTSAENGAAASTVDAGSELSTLAARAEQQIAAGKLEQPVGDNALETYRRAALAWPDDLGVRRIGERLSAAIYMVAVDASAAHRWDAALHAFEVLKTLPSVPASAIVAGASRDTKAPKDLPPTSDAMSGEKIEGDGVD
ncbi:MAG: hypothetical protein ACREFQ_14095, partial [Stellaceae bacterium]